MSIFSIFQGKSKPVTIVNSEFNTALQQLTDAINFPVINFNSELGKKIVALTICAKILAQDVGRLPISIYQTDESGNKVKLYNDYRYRLLHNRPNNYTDAFTYWSTTELNKNFDGNSYGRINRIAGSINSLEFLPSENVIGYVFKGGELYYSVKDSQTSEPVSVNASEILHFKNLSTDGINGRDPKSDLAINLGISYKALVTIDNFYNNGAVSKMALETLIPEGVNAKEWSEQIDAFTLKYGSYSNAGKLLIQPPFTKLNPLSINFSDAQFIETIKYNNGQVAAYFGIPQHKLGNIESSKFNSLMEMQMDYIQNTIAPILAMYRRELELKLLREEELNNGFSIEFDTNALNITDSKTRISNYKEMFGMAATSPNDILKSENLPAYEGGDTHYISTGFMSQEKANMPKPLTNIKTVDASNGNL